MAKPKQTKSGKWRIQVFVGYDAQGKRMYYKETLDTYKEAVQRIARVQLDKKAFNRKSITVKCCFDQYIAAVSAIHSPSTIAGYKQITRNAFQSIQNKCIEDLTQAEVQASVNQYAVNHSPKSVSNAYGFLNLALRFHGHLGFRQISLPRKKKISIAIPTDAEIVQFLALAGHPGMRLAIMLAAGAGLRRSEIAALEWSHVDFKKSIIHINQARVKDSKGELHLKGRKTALSTREILVGKEIIDAFRVLKGSPGQFVVGLTPDAITRRFGRICAKMGVKYRFHDLRHYQASVMLAEGIPDKYAMERMGHSSTNMLRNVYQHTMSDVQRKFSSQLNQRISDRMAEAREKSSIKDGCSKEH